MMRDDFETTPRSGVATEVPERPPAPQPIWDPRTGGWVNEEDLVPVFPREPEAPPQRRLSPVLLAGILGGLAGALLALVAVFAFPQLGGSTVIERRVDAGLATGAANGEAVSVIDIAERAQPWVVHINVTGRQEGLMGPELRQGSGSGVILRSDGFILTNAHVVDGATDIEVILASGDTLSARLVGLDVDTDIAVVQVDRGDLPAAAIGSAGNLRVGETAVAIGSPLGLQQTVTAGIVSALGRQVPRPGGLPPLFDMVQTDASITRGNSGGALIDGRGSIVGINTLVAADPQLGTEGIGFAIPIDIAVSVAEEIIETGRATHPWLGITGGNITPETARQFGIDEGAFVIEVFPGSPAEDAGIEAEDIVVRFSGERIESMDQLVVAIRMASVGDPVEIEVVRNGERITLETTLGEKPEDI